MKSYLNLIPISARVHRRQNRLTLMCIILAVFLVTAIFSMADMWLRMEKQVNARHGNYHIVLWGLSESDGESVSAYPQVEAAGQCRMINYDRKKDFCVGGYYVNERNVILYSVDQTWLSEIRNYPIEGAYPTEADGVMLSADAKALFGVGMGDKITLETPFGGLEYTVTGFCEDDSDFNEIFSGACLYLSREGFGQLQELGGRVESGCYVRFDGKKSLREAIEKLREQYHAADENISENAFMMGLSGESNNETFKNIYSLAAVFFLIILISGVLMISSCMNSDIAQRIKFFGMLRCIGASRQQIIRFVRLEALNWCRIAVPTGCGMGIAVTFGLCLLLHFVVKGEFADIPVFGVSAIGIVSGIVVGVVTVLIAANSPAKRAAGVSPVAAVSGNGENMKNVRHGANTGFMKIDIALGVHHAVSARKNLILVTLSFAFTIILFLGFSACLDLVQKLLPSQRDYNPDVSIVSADDTNSIDREVLEEMGKVPGVKRVFGNMFDLAAEAKINGNETCIDLISYDEYMLDQSKKAVASGDLSKVYGNSDYALAIFNQDTHIDVGDKIEIGGHELELACVISFGIGGSGNTTIVCSEETFTRVTGEDKYILVNAEFTKDAAEETLGRLRALAGENEFSDRREENSEVNSSYWVFRLAAYGFLAIITLITIFNIMNSISMSVSARIRQYGAMRAVGMSTGQLTGMIAAEAATYALSGFIMGNVFGLYLHYMLTKIIIVNHFGGTWKIPFATIGLILLIILVSCAAAVYAPAKRIAGMEITDTINEL